MDKKKVKDKDFLEPKSNIVYIKIFLVVVGMLFFLSLVIKGAQIFQARQFNDYSFTTLFLGKNPYIVYANTRMRVFNVARIHNPQGLSSKDTLKDSIILGIPIRGIVISELPAELSALQVLPFPKTFQMLSASQRGLLVSMNKYDLLALYLSSKSVPNTNINVYTIDQKNTSDTMDEKVYALFKDEDIINEKTSIEIVNTTDVSGLGTKIAKMLKTVGFNVVSVTSDAEVGRSQIISRVDKENKAYKLLSDTLKFRSEFRQDSAIADITVILGDDIKSHL